MRNLDDRPISPRRLRQLTRRTFLTFLALLGTAGSVGARILRGGEDFHRPVTPPPVVVDKQAPWTFFRPDEVRIMEAVIDRLIPADGNGPGGVEAGCLVFLDRQLAGDYGRSTIWYLAGPIQVGTTEQGPQFGDTIAERYRRGLADLDAHCRDAFVGRGFAALSPDEQNAILSDMEKGGLDLGTTDSKSFFEQLLANARQGYLSDPAYGGNRNMSAWRHVGFPGARYDYRSVIARRGEALGLEPVGLYGKGE